MREAAEALRQPPPDSYMQFCVTLGIGDFDGELRLLPPADLLYAFDMPGMAFDGFVVIATGVLGTLWPSIRPKARVKVSARRTTAATILSASEWRPHRSVSSSPTW